MRLIPLLVILSAFLNFSSAFAQQQDGRPKGPEGSEFSIHTGPLLPNQIQGMSEIQPMWGLRYSFPSGDGKLELNAANSRAEGVVYYNAYLSYRYDVHLDEITGFLLVGADMHQWSSPPDDTTRISPGVHVGTGILMPLGDALWFRSEMKFNMNPGTALYIGFGLVLTIPDEPGGGGEGG